MLSAMPVSPLSIFLHIDFYLFVPLSPLLRHDNLCHSMGLHGRHPGSTQAARLRSAAGQLLHDGQRNGSERLDADAVQISGRPHVKN